MLKTAVLCHSLLYSFCAQATTTDMNVSAISKATPQLSLKLTSERRAGERFPQLNTGLFEPGLAQREMLKHNWQDGRANAVLKSLDSA